MLSAKPSLRNKCSATPSSRAYDDDDGFKRLDFTLDECSSDAAWMKKAKALYR